MSTPAAQPLAGLPAPDVAVSPLADAERAMLLHGLVRSDSQDLTVERERLLVRLAVVWLLILVLGAFWVSWLRPAAAGTLSVSPVLPKAGEPAVATLRLANQAAAPDLMRYQLFADGKLVAEGRSQVAAGGANEVQFARTLPLDGRAAQASYAASVLSNQGSVQEAHQLPEYSPQVLSSFVSFAASSTTMMTAVVNMSYYRTAFTRGSVGDFGLVLVLVMLALTIFVEAMSVRPKRAGKLLFQLAGLAQRLRLVLISLYIIFGGLAITRLAILFGALQ